MAGRENLLRTGIRCLTVTQKALAPLVIFLLVIGLAFKGTFHGSVFVNGIWILFFVLIGVSIVNFVFVVWLAFSVRKRR